MAHNYAHYKAFNTYPKLLAASTKCSFTWAVATLEKRREETSRDEHKLATACGNFCFFFFCVLLQVAWPNCCGEFMNICLNSHNKLESGSEGFWVKIKLEITLVGSAAGIS